MECTGENFVITGKNAWRYPKEDPKIDPYQKEHDDLFAAITKNLDYNEAERGAKSTMTAILGRMAGYSGQLIKWDDAIKSDKPFGKEFKTLQEEAPVLPDKDGIYPLPIPGKYEAL